MLVSKTTWCFSCGEPGFGNREIHSTRGAIGTMDFYFAQPGREVAVDSCIKCGATKKTYIGKKWPTSPAIQGHGEYERK